MLYGRTDVNAIVHQTFLKRAESEVDNDVFSKSEASNFSGEANDGFLEHVVEVGGNKPAAR